MWPNKDLVFWPNSEILLHAILTSVLLEHIACNPLQLKSCLIFIFSPDFPDTSDNFFFFNLSTQFSSKNKPSFPSFKFNLNALAAYLSSFSSPTNGIFPLSPFYISHESLYNSISTFLFMLYCEDPLRRCNHSVLYFLFEQIQKTHRMSDEPTKQWTNW